MEKRDAYFDNIKGILVLLVVLGHLLEIFYFDNKVIEYFYTLIYTFHMPAFIFLSGLFFKSDLKKAFYFLKLFLLFQGLKLGLNYYVFNKNITYYSFLYPTWTLWYLLSMFFWYIIGYFDQKIRISVLKMFIISLLIGFIPKINYLLSFQRTFAYLGFFSLGLCINYKNFKNILKRLNIKLIYIYIYILALYCLMLFVAVKNLTLPINLFHNDISYFDINIISKSYLGIFIRIFNFVMAFIISILLFKVIPSKKCFLTKIGKNSLYIYLLHSYFISLINILVKRLV